MIVLDKFDVKKLRSAFLTAKPIAHVVVDNCVADADSLSQCFPSRNWIHWSALSGEYEKNKFFCRDLVFFPDRLQETVRQLTSPSFLEILEEITGIDGLIPDPHLEGGGLHLSTAGGILAPHTDFHIYGRLNLFRQLNLILYLNESWAVGDGGTLRLWDGRARNGEADEVRIDPFPGRIVIFKTDDRSVHGFTDPVADGKLRKSIALYYYTAIDNESFSGDFTTFWRDDVNGMRISLRLLLYRFLLQTSRAFSFLAHLVNPRLGFGWWKVRQEQRRK